MITILHSPVSLASGFLWIYEVCRAPLDIHFARKQLLSTLEQVERNHFYLFFYRCIDIKYPEYLGGFVSYV